MASTLKSRAFHFSKKIMNIESLIYMIIFLNKNKLPWIVDTNKKIKKLDDLYKQTQKLKHDATIDQICHGMPNNFNIALGYVRNELKFDEMPDYLYLQSLFSNININNINNESDQYGNNYNTTNLLNLYDKEQYRYIERSNSFINDNLQQPSFFGTRIKYKKSDRENRNDHKKQHAINTASPFALFTQNLNNSTHKNDKSSKNTYNINTIYSKMNDKMINNLRSIF